MFSFVFLFFTSKAWEVKSMVPASVQQLLEAFLLCQHIAEGNTWQDS
jgi:hypothetical protein